MPVAAAWGAWGNSPAKFCRRMQCGQEVSAGKNFCHIEMTLPFSATFFLLETNQSSFT
jgi:hypothetical protein